MFSRRAPALLFAALVLVAGVLLSHGLGDWVARKEAEQHLQAVEHDIGRMVSELDDRLHYYITVTRSVAGLFAASGSVDHGEWQRFIDAADLAPLNERGAAGVAFAPRLEDEQRAAWEARMHRAYGRETNIRGSARGLAYPVQFVAPLSDTMGRLLGFDLASNPARHAAIDAAVRSGAPALSARVVLEDAGEPVPAAVIMMPVYGALQGQGPRGVVVLGIRYPMWLESVTAAWQGRYAIALSDGTDGTALVATDADRLPLAGERTIEFAGRRLQLRFYERDRADLSYAAEATHYAGFVLSGALALMTFVLATARQRAESTAERIGHELADSERRFALALSATSDGVWEWIPGRDRLFLSMRAQQILFGAPLEQDADWRQVLRCLPVAERRALLVALRAHLRHRQPLDVAVRLPGGAAGAVHLRVRGQAQWDALGNPLRIAGAVSDVTALHQRETDLDRARQFYARVLDLLPHPVLVKDADRRYVLVNRAGGEFFGRAPADLLGQPADAVLPLPAVPNGADVRALADGEVVSGEFRLAMEDGQERVAIIRRAAVEGLDGATVVVAVLTDVTELRRAEGALHASLEELDALFRNSPLGMAMIKVDGTIVRVNHAFATIVGREEARLPGMRYAQLTPESLHRLDREKTINALREGAVTPYERAFVRPDGTEVPVVLSGALTTDADGETAIWTVVEDISERKVAEAELKAVSATNQSIVDAIPDTVLQFDGELRLVAFHLSAGEVPAIDLAAAVGRPLAQIISPARFAAVRPALLRAMDERRVTDLSYNAVDGAGAMQDYEARIAPLDTGGVLVLLRNITAFVRKEAALRESEARFRLMADAAPVVIWLADERLEVTYANRSWLEWTGCSLDEALGNGWMSYVHPDDRGTVLRVGLRAQRKHARYSFEFRVRRADGSHRWLLAVGEPRFAEDGGFVGYIGCGIDITDEKLAQEELRRHRDHLAELVAEQTASVLSAKEAAERASETKSLFLANMSHELRSPMHAILSYARLGEDKCPTVAIERVADYFRRIRTSGDRLLTLLNDLLDLSKLEAGRMVIDAVPMALSTIIEEVAREFEALCSARKLTLVYEIDPQAWRVDADAVRMGQVVRNLLSNAIKFSPEGGRIVVAVSNTGIRAGRRQADTVRARAVSLSVADEGVGIPEDELERVFDKFVQSSKTRTGAGGTGLGLAICKEIVEAHRGTIRAENQALGGARFVVVLPAARADMAAKAERRTSTTREQK